MRQNSNKRQSSQRFWQKAASHVLPLLRWPRHSRKRNATVWRPSIRPINSSLDLPLCSKTWLHVWRTLILIFSDQITSPSEACYYHIRQLRCIRPYLYSSTLCTTAASIVHSKLDYSITVSTIYSSSLNYHVSTSTRSRTFLLASWWDQLFWRARERDQ